MDHPYKEIVNQSLAIANNYLSTDRPDKAVEMLSVVVKIDPDNENLNYLRNYIITVMMGQKPYDSPFFGKRWYGESLDNKSIEIFCDQGMGDTIQMLRYLKELKNKWQCSIVLNCYSYYEKFRELLTQFKFIDQFTKSHVACDYQTNIMAIPAILYGTDDGFTYPARFSEIMKHPIPEQPLIESVQDPIPMVGDLKIGVAWQSNKDNVLSENKSISVELFEPFSRVGKLYSLIPQQAEFIENMFVDSLADTAAVIKEMDLVISVDTAVLHLAGSMRKRTIGLINRDFDPRWNCNNRSVWYPSVILLKQDGEWSPLIENAVDLIGQIS